MVRPKRGQRAVATAKGGGAAASKGDINDDDHQNDTALEQAALLEAVETTTNKTSNDDTISPPVKSFLQLFGATSNKNNNNHSTSSSVRILEDGWTLREQKQILLRSIREFQKPIARRFFSALYELVNPIILEERYLPYDDDDNEDDKCETTAHSNDNSCVEHYLQFLNCACLCVMSYVNGQIEHQQKVVQQSNHDSAIPKPRLDVIDEVVRNTQALHDIILTLNSTTSDNTNHSKQHSIAHDVQSNIVSLCEVWWTSNGPYKERLVLQVLPVLTYAAIHEETKSSVTRLYQMRYALEQIDFHDPSGHELRDMVYRLVSAPKILKLQDGQKLLSYLLQLTSDPALSHGLHKSIRTQIPHYKPQLLRIVGQCYLRAWKDGSTNTREVLETTVLHDYCRAVIHVSQSSTTHSLLLLLEAFHLEKKNVDVEQLLFRLYSGLLWRSLCAPNAQVRINATQVLSHVFPLRNPTPNNTTTTTTATTKKATASNTEVAICKACEAVLELLHDPEPKVRVAASQAVSNILATYWDIVPPNNIRQLLNVIVMDHASDRTSSIVRVSAIHSMAHLVEQTSQSQAILRPLLPILGNLIHDRVDKVRLAVVNLLLRIKVLPGIKYYHVVPVSNLIGQLGAEHRTIQGPVASALTALMVNSFCPTKPQSQLQRTIQLVQDHPQAAQVFYSNVAQHVSVELVAQLAVNVFRTIHTAIESELFEQDDPDEKPKSNRNRSIVNDENEDNHTDGRAIDNTKNALDASNVTLVANLLQTVNVLWESIQAALLQAVNQTSHQFLVKSFSDSAILEVLVFLESKLQEEMDSKNDSSDTNSTASSDETHQEPAEDCRRAIASILSCAARFPSTSTETLRRHVINCIAFLSEGEVATNAAIPTMHVAPHVALLLQWGMTEEVVTALAGSIETAFDDDMPLNFASPEAGSRKRKSSRKTTKKQTTLSAFPTTLPPRVALNIMSDLLRGSHPTSIAARSALLNCTSACEALERALLQGTKFAERILQSNGSRPFQANVSEMEMEYILQVCESHGRFTMHREAFVKDDVDDHNPVENLVKWTAAVVLPVLMPKQDADQMPFIDPDLSHISMSKSLEGMVTSPTPTGPPRRRSNRNRTPVRLDGAHSSIASLSTPQSLFQPSEAAKDLALALLHSILILLSERSSLLDQLSDPIIESIALWLAVLECMDDDVKVHALVGAFCHLAWSLCKNESSFTLLRGLIAKCPESEDGSTIKSVGAVVTKALTLRTPSNMVPKTIQCVLDVVQSMIDDGVVIDPGLPTSVSDLWPTESCGSVLSALTSIMQSKSGSLELTTRLVQSFQQTNRDSEASAELLRFYAKSLYVLCDAETTKANPAIVNQVRTLVLSDAMEGVPNDIKVVLKELGAEVT